MITRRKLLQFLGLGTAAAAVAREAVAQLPAEPGGSFAFDSTRAPAHLEEQPTRFDWLAPAPEQATRRTGRTTRQLLEAVELARQGKSVAFVVESWPMASEARRLVFRHARNVSGNGTRNAIMVIGERGASGRVVIVANNEPRIPTPAALRGYSDVIYDHAWHPSVHEHRYDTLTQRCSCGADRRAFGTIERIEGVNADGTTRAWVRVGGEAGWHAVEPGCWGGVLHWAGECSCGKKA